MELLAFLLGVTLAVLHLLLVHLLLELADALVVETEILSCFHQLWVDFTAIPFLVHLLLKLHHIFLVLLQVVLTFVLVELLLVFGR